ncbi:hypothetical protein [Saccharopolyspora aridisoli]|uniref:hypothetical protein n=1 Tax=Saccharopolyspora aridisoli TaxID=2530385 RepID=UPI001405090E|nr:hypothetical protein [Saccharopolyspora aridisoli]
MHLSGACGCSGGSAARPRRDSREGRGDVYEVEPLDTPDHYLFPEVVPRCRSARE